LLQSFLNCRRNLRRTNRGCEKSGQDRKNRPGKEPAEEGLADLHEAEYIREQSTELYAFPSLAKKTFSLKHA
jgi:hypothetical protein